MKRHHFTSVFVWALVMVGCPLAGCGDFLGIHDSSGSDDAGDDTGVSDTGPRGDATGSSPPADSGGNVGDATDASSPRDSSDGEVDGDAISPSSDPDLWASPLPDMKVFIADVTGDRKADLIGIEPNQVVVWPSDGAQFVPQATPWLSQSPAGDVGIYFADLNDDHRADLIVDDSVAGVHAGVSTGHGFGALTQWNTQFRGDVLTAFSDVNGDGLADGIALNAGGVWVSYGALMESGAPYGTPDTTEFLPWNPFGNCDARDVFGSATGSGKADLIELDVTSGIHVYPSTSSSFDTGDGSWLGSSWTGQQPFCGTEGTYTADVDGDGKSDAIAVEATGIQVHVSTGSAFVVPSSGEDWTSAPFYGAVATFFADVDGDGDADAIAVDNGAVRVWLSTGTSFVSAAHGG